MQENPSPTPDDPRAEPEDGFPVPSGIVPPDLPWPVVLGIDPGTRVVGYGALVVAPAGPRLLACGVLRAGRGAVPDRLARIARDVALLLERVRPRVVVVEEAFHAANARSALRLGEGRGVVLAAAAGRGCEVAQYAPAVAKKAVLGHGGATKAQVRAMVEALLATGALDAPDDATDALALALAHVQRMRLAGALARGRAGLPRPPASPPARP